LGELDFFNAHQAPAAAVVGAQFLGDGRNRRRFRDLFLLRHMNVLSPLLARISHTGWDLRGDRGSYTLTLWR
jgi:hypothetical protein